jgi:hypothetical protein
MASMAIQIVQRWLVHHELNECWGYVLRVQDATEVATDDFYPALLWQQKRMYSS